VNDSWERNGGGRDRSLRDHGTSQRSYQRGMTYLSFEPESYHFVEKMTIASALLQKANKAYATKVTKFFNQGYTWKKDVFLGIRVPEVRQVIKENQNLLNKETIEELIKDERHDFRLCGLLGLVFLYEKNTIWSQESIVDFYLANLEYVNNWDLVDCSCHKILGPWLLSQSVEELTSFADTWNFETPTSLEEMSATLEEKFKSLPEWYTNLVYSQDLWEIRISIVGLLGIHKLHQDFVYCILLYHILTLYNGKTVKLYHVDFQSKDLLYKALGWVIRDSGKVNRTKMVRFLDLYHKYMARVTISYSTEHLSPSQKQKYKLSK
jgi:3-methyladenine DNA glycosylase AlkD